MSREISHLDEEGRASMVDVGSKQATERFARASAELRTTAEVVRAITGNTVAKGSVFAAARLAGIMAAKKTSDLIPLCHPIALDVVEVDLEAEGRVVRIEARVRSRSTTGVEMEAMTAASVAALTVYDMCKAMDRSMEIGPVKLLEKSGGKSGRFRRGEESK